MKTKLKQNNEAITNTKNQKGITLIALVITIIVLIILAGVALNLSLGENGLFQKTEYAKEQYKKAAVKEEIELAILDIQTDRVGKGESFNMDVIVAELPNKLTDITAEKYEDIAKGTYKGYNYIVKEDYTVLIGEEAQIKPRPIVFGEVTWAAGKAQVEITSKTADTIEYQVNGTEDGSWITGTTVSNLNHEDIVYARTNNGTEVTEPQRLDIKDITAPESFTITVPEDTITYNSIKISGTETTDNQTGLRDYAFVVTKDGSKVKEVTGQTVTEYEVTGLAEKTEYIVYMLAYDNAGNERKSNEVTITTPAMPVAKTFGKYVNYGIDIDGNGNTTDDWQIFYKEDDPTSPNYGATYIIPDYYVPASKMTTSLSNAGMSLYSNSVTYRVKWASAPSYKTILDGTDSTKTNVKSIFMYDYTGTANDNVKSVSRLLDVDTWKDDFVTSELQAKGGMAIGGPTINMWVASWNKVYPTEKITATISGTGYLVNGSDDLSLKNYTGYKTDAPNVYFPTKSEDSDGTKGYWLASPSSSYSNYLVDFRYVGDLYNNKYDSNVLGVRPLVYLPKEVTLTPDKTTENLWNINYGE